MQSQTEGIDALQSDVKRLLVPRVSASDVYSPAFRGALNVSEQEDQGIKTSVDEVLVNFCSEYEIQPENIISCISMIRLGWCMLHVGSPVFMMGHSTTRGSFIASVDADIPDGWRDLSESKAILLLLLLASEQQTLPTHADAWGVIRFRDATLFEFESPDHTSLTRYRTYLAGNRSDLDEYESKLARSFSAVRDYMRM
ncbi:hypothetical protein [Paraburkholderia tropica]|uniref:hypothetical protein n=1 Tax=Paraburkholderia tropica TaxID=92647 RepID=UPI002ABDE61B|nr:hypothetical protein [Paraburkholderia tropica]